MNSTIISMIDKFAKGVKKGNSKNLVYKHYYPNNYTRFVLNLEHDEEAQIVSLDGYVELGLFEPDLKATHIICLPSLYSLNLANSTASCMTTSTSYLAAFFGNQFHNQLTNAMYDAFFHQPLEDV